MWNISLKIPWNDFVHASNPIGVNVHLPRANIYSG